MAENYRERAEWQALNRIWKAVPAAARENVRDDFRVITDMIKAGAAVPAAQAAAAEPKPAVEPNPAARAGGETNFLAGLSAEARRLALGLITREGFNIYDYLMELARSSRAADAQELFDAYVSQKDIDDADEAALMELAEVCMAKAGVGV